MVTTYTRSAGNDAGTAIDVDTMYGPQVSGVKHIHLHSSDGTNFTGSVDSRTLASFVPSAQFSNPPQ